MRNIAFVVFCFLALGFVACGATTNNNGDGGIATCNCGNYDSGSPQATECQEDGGRAERDGSNQTDLRDAGSNAKDGGADGGSDPTDAGLTDGGQAETDAGDTYHEWDGGSCEPCRTDYDCQLNSAAWGSSDSQYTAQFHAREAACTLHGCESNGHNVEMCRQDCSDIACPDQQPRQVSADDCDGVDNDEDGLTDEGDARIGANCMLLVNSVWILTPGVGACMNGVIVCVQHCAESELSLVSWLLDDRIDNDCDGQVDENDGLDICDSVDNDQDGQTDEDDPSAGLHCIALLCYGGGTDCKPANGQQICANGVLTCAAICDDIEVIDNELDDDCDGRVDETPCDELVCERGLNECVWHHDGTFFCSAQTGGCSAGACEKMSMGPDSPIGIACASDEECADWTYTMCDCLDDTTQYCVAQNRVCTPDGWCGLTENIMACTSCDHGVCIP